MCMFIILVVSYLSTGLAECLVDSGISHGACKLTRTSRVIKKNKTKKKEIEVGFPNTCKTLPSNHHFSHLL